MSEFVCSLCNLNFEGKSFMRTHLRSKFHLRMDRLLRDGYESYEKRSNQIASKISVLVKNKEDEDTKELALQLASV